MPTRSIGTRYVRIRVSPATVRLSTSVDPSIIGGLIARIGSTVYDASVTRQLEKMKERLTDSV